MKDQRNPEKREYQRYPFQEDIIVDDTIMCMSNNIGENGLFLSTNKFFDENSIVSVNITFKGEKVFVRARVRYCKLGIGMGIEFIDVNDEQEAKIHRIIEHVKDSSLMS